MNDRKEELFAKLKTFDKDELIQYYTSAIVANRAINVLGITVILLMLMYTSVLTIITGGIAAYIFANLGVGLNETIEFIEERIVRMPDK